MKPGKIQKEPAGPATTTCGSQAKGPQATCHEHGECTGGGATQPRGTSRAPGGSKALGLRPPVRRAKHIEQPVLSAEPNPLRWFKEPPTPAGDTSLQLEHTT